MCSGRAAQGASRIWFENLYVIKEVSKLPKGAGPNLKRRYVGNAPVDTWKMGRVFVWFLFLSLFASYYGFVPENPSFVVSFCLGSHYALS